jgi:uncharacterized protein
MTIDWINFSPWSALAGGALIGVAAAMFILLNGRIAGISGIVGGLLTPRTGDVLWRILFIVGMLAAPTLWVVVVDAPQIRIDADYPLLIAAGLLVGLSTRYGAGCTSGHGVCGISRLSPRSIVATLAFMSTGFLTVYIVRHVLFS